MRSLLLLPVRVMRRFFGERCAQTAAALSFSSLLGLVPLITVAVAIITRFPFASGLSDALEKFLLANLLPDKAGAVVAKYVAQFVHKAERVQWIGGALLGITALVQMLTIERAFNAIWRVREKRPLLRRITFHFLALLLGPTLFGGSLAVITFLASVSFGFFEEPIWLDAAFFRALSFSFTVLMFAFLYWAVPARPVSRIHASIGGILAASGFGLMQRLFSLYIANFPAYTVIYGAFAAIPIFLLWLYMSWGVILIGALVVAELPGSPTMAGRGQRGRGSRSNS